MGSQKLDTIEGSLCFLNISVVNQIINIVDFEVFKSKHLPTINFFYTPLKLPNKNPINEIS